ncbi:hypothetical protein [Rubinisphaera italica]|uniref:Uncharacterized protein n=1 Tax=Rubinisphaera italica TaxID=2527969 RepID=A0A5C5XCU4_9PLAN|nr:hypothetical protein [Rubinisphaera italica]TWT60005.1 hypothetical protein Pan54_07170 [Rubinisphaera italica]
MNSSQPQDAKSSKLEFDPHSENITSRDWTFMAYLVGICLIPLVLMVIAIFALMKQNPDFDNFPKDRIPIPVSTDSY